MDYRVQKNWGRFLAVWVTPKFCSDTRGKWDSISGSKMVIIFVIFSINYAVI